MNYVYEFTNGRKITKREFIHWFQKKFLYTIRKFKMISQRDVIGYENKGDFRGVVLENLLNLYTEKSQVDIVKLPSKKITKIAVPNTTDTEADKISSIIIKGNASKLKDAGPIIGKTIKPLYLFLDKEVLLYAKLMKLKCRKTTESEDKLGKFVESLEEKHPEIKHSIIKSYLNLYS